MSPCQLVCFNFSSLVGSIDLLPYWGIERQCVNEGEKILLQCLDQIIGLPHPPILNLLPAHLVESCDEDDEAA